MKDKIATAGPRGGQLALRCLVMLALAYLILPLAILLPVSLTDQRSLTLPVDGLSLQHYSRLVHDPGWIRSAWQSAFIAACATFLASFFGISSAIGCWLIGPRWARPIRLLLLLPLIVPPIIFAVAAFRLFADLGLLDTLIGLILAHTMGAIPFVVIAAETSLQQMDRSLVPAARSLGAGLVRTAWLVVTPNIKPGIISGAVFAFLHSWDEVVVSLFLSSRDVRTLPRSMWEAMAENLDPIVACAAMILLIITVSILVVEHRVKKSLLT